MDFQNNYNMLHKRIHLNNICSASLEFLGFVEFEPSESGLEHMYPCWSYSYVEGNEGIFYFDDKKFVVPPGTGVFIPSYLKHYLHCPGPNKMKLIYFGFNCDFKYDNVDIFQINKEIYNYPFVNIFNNTISCIMKEMNIEKNEQTLFQSGNIILGNVIDFFNLFNNPEDLFINRNDEGKRIINDARNILTRDISKNVCLNEMARQLYISERQLAKLFVDITGLNFKAYCLMIKMEYASRLIYSTSKSITEISYEPGFCDIYYFSRKFKEYFNCSPGSLRKKVKSKK